MGDWDRYQDQVVELSVIEWPEPRRGIFHESDGMIRLTPIVKGPRTETELIPVLDVLQVKLVDPGVVAQLRREAEHS